MNKKGFTLIELLVVIAIIGLLSTLAVVALSSARLKARDSKRLSDLKQIQTALELYYTDRNEYPTDVDGVVLGVGATCLSALEGLNTACPTDPYMGLIPKDPLDAQTYSYISADGSTYTITAQLEGAVGSLNADTTIEATPAGIQQTPAA